MTLRLSARVQPVQGARMAALFAVAAFALLALLFSAPAAHASAPPPTIAPGETHTCFIKFDGTTTCWGGGLTSTGVYPNYGQAMGRHLPGAGDAARRWDGAPGVLPVQVGLTPAEARPRPSARGQVATAAQTTRSGRFGFIVDLVSVQVQVGAIPESSGRCCPAAAASGFYLPEFESRAAGGCVDSLREGC